MCQVHNFFTMILKHLPKQSSRSNQVCKLQIHKPGRDYNSWANFNIMPLLLTPQSTLWGYFEMSKVIHLTTCFKCIYDFRLHPPVAHSVSSLPPPIRQALPPLNSFQPSVVDSYGTQCTLMCSKIIMYIFAFLSKNVSFSETKTLPVSAQGYIRRW